MIHAAMESVQAIIAVQQPVFALFILVMTKTLSPAKDGTPNWTSIAQSGTTRHGEPPWYPQPGESVRNGDDKKDTTMTMGTVHINTVAAI
ncbi:MAG: hypothetical protein ACR2P2_17765 [Nakamurella sp.]